ncbi:hypothetical protein [Ascidiimonas sp. W6]|uniref:hypothetical protein n=1 Tax=Ascidiimonas meishanensis TaxID=3128903 RepID=UPI0030EC67EC
MMRSYFTILFSFTLMTAMLLPSIINLVDQDAVLVFDLSEEEKQEKQEKELEKEKIVFDTVLSVITSSSYLLTSIWIDAPEKYAYLFPEIYLPPPELLS